MSGFVVCEEKSLAALFINLVAFFLSMFKKQVWKELEVYGTVKTN